MKKRYCFPLAVILIGPIAPHAVGWARDVAGSSSPPVYVEVSSRKVVNQGGHTATYVRVRRPNLPNAPLPPPPRALTTAEQTRIAELEKKTHSVLSVSATVYLSGKRVITELRWRDEGGGLTHCAYSNADFRYLTQLNQLETETAVYSWFPFLDVCDLSEWPADQDSPIPRGLELSTSETEYKMEARALARADQDVTLAGLDYLHAYYAIHYAELKQAYETRMAENAAREEELRRNPPKAPDVIMRWWPRTEKP